ncbi:MAG: uncharacterized protein KVP18_004662 [Porospora cf. gigantea A]|uniref:uncharacterized protein n=2 Tax=Porospora cf. gigantea A TaxID=2853593 RepID=UPI0035595547|nr:MAG: hypothetical protein KVP18_004662 [Porospora cf. gigantea A]
MLDDFDYPKSFEDVLTRRIPPHYGKHYVDYAQCKYLIYKLKRTETLCPVDRERVFQERLNAQTDKVNNFALKSAHQISSGLKTAAKHLREFSHDIEAKLLSGATAQLAASSRVFFERVELQLDVQSAEIVHLDGFMRLNVEIVDRLGRIYDSVLGTNHHQWLLNSILREPFCATRVDTLLVLLSLAWERWRDLQAEITCRIKGQTAQAADHGVWTPPEAFVRSTTKYWVPPENVVRTKAFILKRMPFLVFGYSTEQLMPLLDPFGSLQRSAHDVEVVSDGQMVSSVYFDNESATSYSNRIRKMQGAQLLRLRWYGEHTGELDKPIFVERKTHHEGWSGETSTKERFQLRHKAVVSFLAQELDLPVEAAKIKDERKRQHMLTLATQVSEAIQDLGLEPMLRTSYLRSAFQLADNNEVRFSLDCNLIMVNEFRSVPDRPLQWCRVGEEILGKDDVVRFPYGVLEVKLQAAQPDWVSALLADGGARMVYKFSKFQHGMAFLHRDKLTSCPLPHWVDFFEEKGFKRGIDAPPPPEVRTRMGSSLMLPSGLASVWNLSNIHTLTQNSVGIQLPTDVTVNQIFAMASSQLTPGQKTLEWLRASCEQALGVQTVRKLDPKAAFACERNLLHYLNLSLFVSALAFSLLHFAFATFDKRPACLSLLLFGIVGVTMLLALKEFIRRDDTLRNRYAKQQSTTTLHSSVLPMYYFSLVNVTLLAALVSDV